MDSEKLNILVVEDHPFLVDAYKMALSSNYKLTIAYDCEQAFTIITNTLKTFDIVLLDYSLPVYEAKNVYSGEDLAVLVKKHHPQSKIMISTSHTEALLIYGIIKKISPNGLLIKRDFKIDELLRALDIILKDDIYQSETVKKCIKKVVDSEVFLDDANRDIVSYIAKGIQTKNLCEYLPYTIRTIHRKKQEIKDFLGVPNESDENMIYKAGKLGFVFFHPF